MEGMVFFEHACGATIGGLVMERACGEDKLMKACVVGEGVRYWISARWLSLNTEGA